MNRFQNLGKIVVACVIGMAVSTTAYGAGEVYKWKLATTWGPTLTPFIDAPRRLSKMVNKMSKGRLQIEVVASNKHKKPFKILEMVQSGEYEMGHTAAYYWAKKDTALMPLTTMPFGMTAPEQYAWFYEGGGMALMEEAYQKFGVLSYPGGNTGNQMGGWFKKEINSLEDLKGLKMRIPGFAGKIMGALGVKVTNLPPSKLSKALESGELDALEWVGPGMDIKFGFHKIAPYYYAGWHEPATELQYLVNTKKYKALPKDLQEILRVAMRLTAYDMYIQLYHMHAVSWAKIKKEYPHIVIKSFPMSIMDAMRDANDKLLTDLSAKNPMLKKILDSQKSYLKQARDWTKISDFLYLVESL